MKRRAACENVIYVERVLHGCMHGNILERYGVLSAVVGMVVGRVRCTDENP